jgi:hypothetical protein
MGDMHSIEALLAQNLPSAIRKQKESAPDTSLNLMVSQFVGQEQEAPNF